MRYLLLALVISLSSPALQATPLTDDAAAIGTLMHTTWDRPGQPLKIAAMAIAERYAIVTWEQDSLGGRAVLVKSSDAWKVALCAGAAVTQLDTLTGMGISVDVATALISDLQSQEATLSSAQREKIDAFMMQPALQNPTMQMPHQ